MFFKKKEVKNEKGKCTRFYKQKTLFGIPVTSKVLSRKIEKLQDDMVRRTSYEEETRIERIYKAGKLIRINEFAFNKSEDKYILQRRDDFSMTGEKIAFSLYDENGNKKEAWSDKDGMIVKNYFKDGILAKQEIQNGNINVLKKFHTENGRLKEQWYDDYDKRLSTHFEYDQQGALVFRKKEQRTKFNNLYLTEVKNANEAPHYWISYMDQGRKKSVSFKKRKDLEKALIPFIICAKLSDQWRQNCIDNLKKLPNLKIKKRYVHALHLQEGKDR